ncbi:MAG: 2-oxoacid:acceptor oxidoreductase subunit alpha [Leptospiraceae bacterium]|nr:2-oxoacid:acceptor oxidoreductase subunit alpha [Leptospiraceae bacterium]MCP5503376.1 2-oxoacid:acceptor oxidoreductase subunit alpha [Leptospiraceae bacterium]
MDNKEKKVEVIKSATIRFTGDSGDGMQLTGSQFTSTSAIVGNDLATFPDFPAEIRAPAGTVPGVSGFQLNFSSEKIHTPGDSPDVLIAMNPAALKANIADLKTNGILIVNTDSFTDKDLEKAGYKESPITTDLKNKYQVIEVQISKLTGIALEEKNLSSKEIDRTKNMFALGMTYWMFSRPLDPTIKWIEDKFKGKEDIIEANIIVLKKGFHYAETAEIFISQYQIPGAKLEPGTYRNITGNSAIVLGLVTASYKTHLPLFLGSYPITPASDILHDLSKYKNYHIYTFQAEDEIAAVSAAIGSAYAGGLAVTSTSGPGVCLKSEAINLAIMAELPIVIVNIQRGGPSTGLPTKTEQSDLLQVLYGRNGESPLVVISASTPTDCFDVSLESVRLALKYMTPVFLLSDGYIANGAEPWRIPNTDELPEITHNQITSFPEPKFRPFARNEETLGRHWAIPGTPGLEHRIGGLEKDYHTGNVSYDPNNHEKMVHTRAEKIAGIANDIPDQEVYGEKKGKLLVVGWGSTFGAIRSAVENFNEKNPDKKVSHAHVRYLNPFPKNFKSLLESFDTILVPELNLGQLSFIIQGNFGIKVEKLNKVKGRPFTIQEVQQKIEELIQ